MGQEKRNVYGLEAVDFRIFQIFRYMAHYTEIIKPKFTVSWECRIKATGSISKISCQRAVAWSMTTERLLFMIDAVKQVAYASMAKPYLPTA
jgi:hypothetical protein